MKNAGMAGAVALVGVGLITIGLGNFVKAPQAMATYSIAEHGPEDPVVVGFGSLGASQFYNQEGFLASGFWRLWSDGRIQVRLLGYNRPWSPANCNGSLIVNFGACSQSLPVDSGWMELPSPPGGDGYVCQADINGDRNVDGADLGLLLGYWGENPICADATYPCFDLGNLGGPVAFK